MWQHCDNTKFCKHIHLDSSKLKQIVSLEKKNVFDIFSLTFDIFSFILSPSLANGQQFQLFVNASFKARYTENIPWLMLLFHDILA